MCLTERLKDKEMDKVLDEEQEECLDCEVEGQNKEADGL